MATWIAVFLGGGLGSLFRFGISKALVNYSTNFPLATLTSNILSCIVMIIGMNYLLDKPNNNEFLKPFLLIGFCGGFSTFSTFSLENFELLKNGNYFFLAGNIFISISICITIFYFALKNG